MRLISLYASFSHDIIIEGTTLWFVAYKQMLVLETLELLSQSKLDDLK